MNRKGVILTSLINLRHMQSYSLFKKIHDTFTQPLPPFRHCNELHINTAWIVFTPSFICSQCTRKAIYYLHVCHILWYSNFLSSLSQKMVRANAPTSILLNPSTEEYMLLSNVAYLRYKYPPLKDIPLIIYCDTLGIPQLTTRQWKWRSRCHKIYAILSSHHYQSTWNIVKRVPSSVPLFSPPNIYDKDKLDFFTEEYYLLWKIEVRTEIYTTVEYLVQNYITG